ncbi:hypothetical protein [Candidatus Bathycorpusculum sp.]|uniref:hypothetical protein n=1 Tax=Candidatus Bathycorpusculum sp. TaxID=2994959 RepID=UPI00282118BA|nr:hypothetical protein [Candidatus Termitimicrobium sp.]MCL2686884.1 hypothetical protein [Candidatus Termitimicrobium sp.]
MSKTSTITATLETGIYPASCSSSLSSEDLDEFTGLVYVQYVDHVVFHRAVAEDMGPQIRETVGWLISETEVCVTICYDRDTAPPTLRGGDAKASGLVLLKSAILVLKKLCEQVYKFKTDRCNFSTNQIRAKTSEKFGVSNKQETTT